MPELTIVLDCVREAECDRIVFRGAFIGTIDPALLTDPPANVERQIFNAPIGWTGDLSVFKLTIKTERANGQSQTAQATGPG